MAPPPSEKKDGLERTLTGYQIFFITLSGVIGGGVFFNDGSALVVAGPLGVIIAVVAVSVVAICVMECVSELVQLFPAPTAIYYYIEFFLDEDFAWVASIAYWWTYSSTFALQVATAGDNAVYWDMPVTLRSIVFYILIPIVLLGMNLLPVYIYGWAETVGGALKVILVIGVSILFFVLTGPGFVNDPYAIDDNFQHTSPLLNNGVAQCAAIPLIAFSFLAVDAVVVTAREAKKDALRWPSMSVSWAASGLYFLAAMSETLNVRSSNPALPQPSGGIMASVDKVPKESSAMIIIAIRQAVTNGATGLRHLPGFLNACFIFSKISSANTVLYLASRLLHGLTLRIDSKFWLAQAIQKLSQIPSGWRSPAPAVLASALAFCWLPFLRLIPSERVEAAIYVLATSANVSLLTVWAAICASYLRFWYWTSVCAEELAGTRYDRKRKGYPYSVMSWLQPVPAIIGLLGSVLVIVFGAAGWWGSGPPPAASEIAGAFGAPIVMLIMWVLLKARTLRKLRHDGNDLSEAFVWRPVHLERKLDELDYIRESDGDTDATHQTHARTEEREGLLNNVDDQDAADAVHVGGAETNGGPREGTFTLRHRPTGP